MKNLFFLLLTILIVTSCDKTSPIDEVEEVVEIPTATTSYVKSSVTVLVFGSKDIKSNETKSINAKQGDVFSVKYVPTTYNISNGSSISYHADELQNADGSVPKYKFILDDQEYEFIAGDEYSFVKNDVAKWSYSKTRTRGDAK